MNEVWKMLHMLYLYGRPGLSEMALNRAGAGCYNRAVAELRAMGAVRSVGGQYELTEVASFFMRTFLVVRRLESRENLRVDFPQVFVAMPYGEPFSREVYDHLIKPGVESAGLQCNVAIEAAHIGRLEALLWDGILAAGLIIAEVTKPNVNVFYELGAARALGKSILLLKQKGSRALPADVEGALYVEYDLDHLSEGASSLTRQLQEWSKSVSAYGVKELERIESIAE